MKASTAEYWLLKEISNLDAFGQEMFHSKFGYNGVSMIGVGPHGITVYRNQDEETQKWLCINIYIYIYLIYINTKIHLHPQLTIFLDKFFFNVQEKCGIAKLNVSNFTLY